MKEQVSKPTNNSAKERVEIELKELEIRLNKLGNFLNTPNFDQLSITQKSLLQAQHSIMLSYTVLLKLRLLHWGD